MAARVHSALALALALTACSRGRQPGDPTPLAVNPSRGSADAAVRIEISGRDLDAHVKADFTTPGASSGLEAGYAARLEPASGGAVPLGDVRLTDRHTLLATVPAGLPPGSYRLAIADPTGRSGALEHAYHVLSSAGSVARFEVVLVGTTPRAGVAFPICLVARDAGGAVVDGFTGSVTVTDTAGALAPASAGPFVLGRWRGTVTVRDVVAADALTVEDGAARSGSSAPFDVVAGPPMALAIAGPPLAVAVGICSPRVDLALRDAYGHPTVAEADVAVELESAPPGLPLFSDAACTRPVTALTLAAGSGASGFHLRAGTAGAVTVRALPASLPSVSQLETVTP